MATLERQLAQSAINNASIWVTNQEWAEADAKYKLERSMMHLERELRELACDLGDEFDAEECKRLLGEFVNDTSDEKILSECIIQEVETEIVDWATASDETKENILINKLWLYREKFTEKQWEHKYPCFDMKVCSGFLVKFGVVK